MSNVVIQGSDSIGSSGCSNSRIADFISSTSFKNHKVTIGICGGIIATIAIKIIFGPALALGFLVGLIAGWGLGRITSQSSNLSSFYIQDQSSTKASIKSKSRIAELDDVKAPDQEAIEDRELDRDIEITHQTIKESLQELGEAGQKSDNKAFQRLEEKNRQLMDHLNLN